jgi:hypothetical protein
LTASPTLFIAAVEALLICSKAWLAVAIACWKDSIMFGVWPGRFFMKLCRDSVMSWLNPRQAAR